MIIPHFIKLFYSVLFWLSKTRNYCSNRSKFRCVLPKCGCLQLMQTCYLLLVHDIIQLSQIKDIVYKSDSQLQVTYLQRIFVGQRKLGMYMFVRSILPLAPHFLFLLRFLEPTRIRGTKYLCQCTQLTRILYKEEWFSQVLLKQRICWISHDKHASACIQLPPYAAAKCACILSFSNTRSPAKHTSLSWYWRLSCQYSLFWFRIYCYYLANCLCLICQPAKCGCLQDSEIKMLRHTFCKRVHCIMAKCSFEGLDIDTIFAISICMILYVPIVWPSTAERKRRILIRY